ncbi:asparagine synthase (glutamine-hydrolyzing) [Candidatus Woesearchaeota archaeon]|nr:asparagine synthase (glutamine-hydrolyzing) [Candidatus Woesearchaeota archaeon]MCF8012930.1 asparagine synthase (glutamine-hydrolyzing) [Candidatus Woesearchaeota archaeon]
MCGINGFNWTNEEKIKNMNLLLKHRGPDNSDKYIDKSVSLGHTRLAILDLQKRSNQPMKYKHFVVIFNGEIYNFIEIKNILIQKGHKFNTSSDTEIILHAYEEWGENCVKNFNGMWSFCIYDNKKQILFLSRDRFGIKPLYYYHNKNKFIFSSEIKSIRIHEIDNKLSDKGLNFYFYQKYIGDDFTIFENIHKLKPGNNLIYYLKKDKHHIYSYYSIEKELNSQKTKNILKKIKKSTKLRLISDVPIGCFLSGGLDSSLITAISKKIQNKINSFSISFKEKSYDESKYSDIVSKYLKTKHHKESANFQMSEILYLIENMDEPFGDSSLIPTFNLCKSTRKHVTVALSGDGADEIFGGYDVYYGYKINKIFPKILKNILSRFINLIPPSKYKLSIDFKLKKFFSSKSNNPLINHLDWLSTFNDLERKNLLKSNYKNKFSFIKIPRRKDFLGVQILDINNYLTEDILKKVDYASMLNSLEVRVPFLDHNVVEAALSLQENNKISIINTKIHLKKLAKKILPKKIINRKKRGFTVPISSIILKNKEIKKIILSEEFNKHNILNITYVNKLYKEHINNKFDHSRKLWLIFIFNYWYIKNGIGKKN